MSSPNYSRHPWKTAPLADIAEVKLGKMLDRAKHTRGRKLPYLRNVNIRWGLIDTSDLLEMHFDEDELERFAVQDNDVLVCEGGEPGRAAVWQGGPTDIKFQKALHRVRFKEPFEPKLLVYLLKHMAASGSLERRFTGSTIKHFTREAFVQLPVPVPPLNEQRRIVAEIEKQSTRLDSAVASISRVQKHLQGYRGLVLNEASDLRATTAVPMSSILREPLRNGHSAKASESGTGLRAFTLTAVTSGDFSETNTKLTVASPDKVRDLWAQPGDLFVERSNTPELVGTTRLYRGPANFAFFPDLLIRVRTDSAIARPEYVEICMQSDRIRRYFRSRAQGISGSMPKIDQQSIAQVMISLPPIEEQDRIIARVERRLSVINSVERLCQINLHRAEALHQSILKKAFSGQI